MGDFGIMVKELG